MKAQTYPRCAHGRAAHRLPIPALLLLALASPTVSAQNIRRIASENGDPIRHPSYLTEYDGKLFFRANNLTHGNNVELWAFDGAQQTPIDMFPGKGYSYPQHFIDFNGKLYFSADDGYDPGLAGLEPAVFAMLAAPEVTLGLSIRPAAVGFVLTLANSDGSAATGEQMAGVKVYKTQDLALPLDQWQLLSETPVISNGVIEIQAPDNVAPRCF